MEIADTLKVGYMYFFPLNNILEFKCYFYIPAVFTFVWGRPSRCQARKSHV